MSKLDILEEFVCDFVFVIYVFFRIYDVIRYFVVYI